MSEFDPNELPQPPDHRWGSYCRQQYGKNRGPWKTHDKLQHVRSAIMNARQIVVYEKIDDRWVERYRHEWRTGPPTPQGPVECVVCGGVDGNLWSSWSSDADFERVWCHYRCQRRLPKRR